MAVKMVFDGDSAKLRSELDRVIKSEQTLVSQLQAATKESEKGQVALLKEIELRKKIALEKKEAVEQGRKLTAENAKQARENERLNQTIEKNARAQNSAFAKGMAGAANMAAGYLSIGTAINIATEALEHQKRISEASLSATERIARAQRQVMLNMPGASGASVTGIDQQIRAAASRSRAPDLAAFYESVASSSAATGGNLQAAIRGTEATVPFTRLAPQDLPVISSAALEIGKAAGSSDYERSIGMLLQVGGVTRQPNMADFARSLPEALAAGSGNSTDKVAGMEFAAETYATLSNRVADVTGRQTSTSVANMVVKMTDFFQKRNDDPGTPGGRFAAIQADPTLREEFLAGLGGEVVFKTPMRQMFTPGSDVANELAKNQEAINYGTASSMYAATAANVTGGTAELRQAEVQAQFAGQHENYLSDPTLSREANARKIFGAANADANPGWTGYAAAAFGRAHFEAMAPFGDPVATGISQLEMQRDARQSWEQTRASQGAPSDEAAVRQIQLLEEAVQALKSLDRAQGGAGSSVVREE